MSRKKDLLEGRTKEWDRNDWQGRRKDQIESYRDSTQHGG